MAPRSKERATQEKSRKRRRNLFKKAHELAHLTNSDLYVVMHQAGRYYTYTSVQRPGWPPNEEQIEHCDHAPQRTTSSHFAKQPIKDRNGASTRIHNLESPQQLPSAESTVDHGFGALQRYLQSTRAQDIEPGSEHEATVAKPKVSRPIWRLPPLPQLPKLPWVGRLQSGGKQRRLARVPKLPQLPEIIGTKY